jgi:cytochrome c553
MADDAWMPRKLSTLLPSLHAGRLAALALAAAALAGAAVAAAPFEDSMAQRTLACTACHGAQGRAGPDGYYPRLAGKPAGYLYNQLLNFRDGRRHYGLMTQLVAPLSDAYLMEMAQYFSALELPYPPPAAAAASAAGLQRGRQLVLLGDAARNVPACVSCHGQALTGVLPGVPGLLGLPRDYLNAQLGAWKTGQRRAHAPDCMKQVVDRLSLDELNAVTGWLAAQPVPASSKPAAAAPVPAPGAPTLSCAGVAKVLP